MPQLIWDNKKKKAVPVVETKQLKDMNSDELTKLAEALGLEMPDKINKTALISMIEQQQAVNGV